MVEIIRQGGSITVLAKDGEPGPKGDTGSVGPPGEVTAEAVEAALGFTPVSPDALIGKLDKAGDEQLSIGVGTINEIYWYPGEPVPEGQHLQLTRGTDAAPDSELAPLARVDRVVRLKDDDLPFNTMGSFWNASAVVTSRAATGSECTAMGFVASAYNNNPPSAHTSTQNWGSTNLDAQGALFIAQVGPLSHGLANAFTAFARIEGPGRGSVQELHLVNDSGAVINHNPAGYSSNIFYVTCKGASDAGVILSACMSSTGSQFDVGLHFAGNSKNGRTGAIKTAVLKDDSHAITTFDINGSHTTVLDTQGATLTGPAVHLANAHTIQWGGDTALERTAPSNLRLTDGNEGLASLEAENGSFSGLVSGSNLIGNNTGDQASIPHPVPLPTGGFAYTDAAISAVIPTTVAMANDRFDLVPFVPSSSITIDQLAINVTAAVAGSLAKLSLWSAGADGLPADLIIESGNLDLGAAGLKTFATSQSLTKNTTYWLGVRMSGTSTVTAHATASLRPLGFRFSATAAQAVILRRTLAFATATPASFGPVVTAEFSAPGGTPALLLRAA